MSKSKYKYYACCKYGNNGGMFLDGRNSCERAYDDLKRISNRVRICNDMIFIGVIKCKDGNPLNHIIDIGNDNYVDIFREDVEKGDIQ